MADVGTMLAPNGALLYLDEIQYFNKKQQQSLLEYMENGKITLIASTTENPYFYVYNALLSRSTVFEFKPLTAEEAVPAVERALHILAGRSALTLKWEEGVPAAIAAACGGDVRKAINVVELLNQAAQPDGSGALFLTVADAAQLSQRSAMRYDREGDDHYDLLSALQKSIRGSDPDAAVYYLGRLLVAGDLLSPCRRLLVIAAEDIGLAYPQAISITKACVDAAVQLGLPEARLPLAEAVLLATAPKSNSAHNAIIAAMQDIQAGRVGDIPRHLKNVHADSAGSEKPQAYKYPHLYPKHYVKQQYLPDDLVGTTYYEYADNKTEQAAKRYWDLVRGEE